MPIEDCIENVKKTYEDSVDANEDATFHANIEHEALENITDVVLCARVYRNSDRKLLTEEHCLANADKNISHIRNKQRSEKELTNSDKESLVGFYFDHCPSDHKDQYKQKYVIVDVKIALAAYMCDAAFFKFEQKLDNESHSVQSVAIAGYVIIAIGLLGALLSLSIYCRPSFLRQHHIGYICICRSVFDVFMLVYCILMLHFGRGETDAHHLYIDKPSGTTNPYGTESLVQCCAVFIFFMPSEIGTVLLTMALSLQRLIAVAIPFKAKVYLNSNVAKKTCAAVLCICVVVSVIFFTVVYTIANDNSLNCVLTAASQGIKDTFFIVSLVWSIIFVALPWLAIVVIAISTLYHLVIARRKRAQMAAANQNTSSHDELNVEDIVMVLVIVGSFLVALIPEILLNVIAILRHHIDMAGTQVNIEAWSYVVLAVKSSTNFPISFGFNPKFREIFLGYFNISRD